MRNCKERSRPRRCGGALVAEPEKARYDQIVDDAMREASVGCLVTASQGLRVLVS
jgi:hypothetical protein